MAPLPLMSGLGEEGSLGLGGSTDTLSLTRLAVGGLRKGLLGERGLDGLSGSSGGLGGPFRLRGESPASHERSADDLCTWLRWSPAGRLGVVDGAPEPAAAAIGAMNDDQTAPEAATSPNLRDYK